jgi:hypothetical protein
LARCLRRADREEIIAARGPDVEATLRAGVAFGGAKAALTPEGRIIALFGCVPSEFGGVPWLLASDLIDQHRKELVRLSARYIGLWLQRHGLLVNFVDARNGASVAWLRRLGFELLPAMPFGVEGRLFHMFRKARSHV